MKKTGGGRLADAFKIASDAILGSSLINLNKLVEEFAKTGENIFFAGAPGVGKELFANLYAAASNRKICPINMTGIPESLIDSTLFGAKKGSFSGAYRDITGIITKAKGKKHCFFLDELGDIPANTQAKLLRFIQFGEIREVGSDVLEKIDPKDLRVVAASNKPEFIRDDLKDRFRCLRIPTLVERRHDIPLLLKHFTAGTGVAEITTYTLNGLAEIERNYDEEWSCMHPWKGNIRELKRVVEDAIFLCKKRNDTILKSEDFPSVFWPHKILEPWEQHLEELENPPWKTPATLHKHQERYGSCEPYNDESKIVHIKGLEHVAKSLPYHYFMKPLPEEVSRGDRVIEEIRKLHNAVANIGNTLLSANNKIPNPKPTQQNQITYNNTSPKLFEEQFYDYQVRQKRTVAQIIKMYNLSEGTVKRKNTAAKKRTMIASN